MNDLSVPSPAIPAQQSDNQSADPPTAGVVTPGSKEIVGGRIDSQEHLRDATAQEVNIPKEVASAGVKVRPTTIPIPAPVARMGVKPAGTNVPVATTSNVKLPLSDVQIAQGLHEGVTSSLRWLTEWCIRRLKQLHVAVKSVHGKLVRSKT